jgi:uncharacterized membrane protein YkvA (DUF1232 family)
MSLFDRLRRVGSLMRDPRTPALPRIAVGLAVIYLLWPLDLIPDFAVPVAGYFDDLVAIWLALRWLVKAGTAARIIPVRETRQP